MALDPMSMKDKFKKRIFDSMKREFADKYAPPDVEDSWKKLADALSDIAIDLVQEITTKAQVLPGIPVATAGSPAAQSGSTVGPGQIA